MATWRQLLRGCGQRLPCLRIRDWPDFARRGVMLDISRGRVPTLPTLLDLAEKLAGFKINELQLYTEHTFAYRQYRCRLAKLGRAHGPGNPALDAQCLELGIDLVPNQNSFGHLRYFLADPGCSSSGNWPSRTRPRPGIFCAVPPRWPPDIRRRCPFCAGCTTNCCRIFPARISTWAAMKHGTWAKAGAGTCAPPRARAGSILTSSSKFTGKCPRAAKP